MRQVAASNEVDDAPEAKLDPGARGGGAHIRSGILLSAIQILGFLLTIGQEIFIAHLFGARQQMDGYLAAWVVPTMLATIVASALQNAVIPHFAQRRAGPGLQSAWELASEALGGSIVLFLAISVLCLGAARWVIAFTTAGASSGSVSTALSVYPIGVAFAFVSLLSGLLGGLCAAVGRFVIPSLLSNVATLLPVLFLWLGGKSLGILALPFGLLASAGLQALILAYLLGSLGLRLRFPRRATLTELRPLASDSAAVAMSLVPLALMGIGERHVAAAGGEGAASHLFYAAKLVSAATSLLSTAMGVMGVPLLSAYLARGERERFRRAFSLLFRLGCYLATAAIVGLEICGHPLVEALFQRGIFSSRDSDIVSDLLSWYAVGLLYAVVFPVLNGVIMSLRRSWALPFINGAGLLAYWVLALWAPSRPDVAFGLAQAYGLAYTVILATATVYLAAKSLVDRTAVFKALGRSVLLVPMIAGPLWIVHRELARDEVPALPMTIALAGAGAFTAATAVALVDREVLARILAAVGLRGLSEIVRPGGDVAT